MPQAIIPARFDGPRQLMRIASAVRDVQGAVGAIEADVTAVTADVVTLDLAVSGVTGSVGTLAGADLATKLVSVSTRLAALDGRGPLP